MVKITQTTHRRLMELVLLILRQKGKPMSTNELAKTMGRSWEFTNSLLLAMKNEGLIHSTVYGQGKFWMLR